ncbi:MAG TPA: CHASE2 domain-containing protein, partial [Stellaceae bacterium]|nr:CHASE2 domain-containing protein [Stellaceae bacterium]
MKRLLSILRRGVIYWLPLALLLATALAHLVVPEEFDQLSSLVAFDVYQRLEPRDAAVDAPVLIVDIDEPSLKRVGQWPWPRSTLAQLVDRLREAGAAVIAFDVLFSEADRTSPQMLMSLLTDRGASVDEAKRLLAAMQDPDTQFAKAVAAAPV